MSILKNMTTANLLKDKLILELVQSGHPRVYRNGRVFNRYGKVLSGWIDHDGYNRITVRIEGKKYSIRRHRLIWITFNSLIIDPSLVVNHRNGKKKCNSLLNLELVTKSANLQHAWNIGLRG